ncbi:unnamed protein product [Zymoseptoria tritici ST99CH_1E4]|uniref:Glycoside hydrolase family 5 domain-containing protein n=1 Tax=Zymoseptoria tritici ST99CH_1E4 TaxID=1276532 RepID=A0A2H1GEV4_ZYMTR|nr:unnamed protein product [Zymoseptoria tritici ST99CH_1E4]
MLLFPLLTLLASTLFKQALAFPNTPFTSSNRDILDTAGNKIVYKGVNWPGAADVMIPEGLQYQSIANIVSGIKSLGLNVVRLTFAIEMVDDIFSNSASSTLSNALNNALGSTNGPTVLAQILKKNPQFTSSTTRLQVFDAVAAELANQGIWVHLDNHMSKGKWCCNGNDGNTWFGDTEFDVSKWQRGLAYMADHGKQWPSFASIGLRNELRHHDSSSPAQPYDWAHWYEAMVPAAEAVYKTNPNILIFFSGLDYDKDITALVNKQHLGSGHYFDPRSFDFGNRVVMELHNYQNNAKTCDSITSGLNHAGFNAMDVNNSGYYHVPVVLTEFGFDQNGKDYNSVYAQCIKTFMTGQPGGPGGWMQWALGGSYYIREGTQDFDETWGLYNHDWSAWRDANAIAYTKAFAQAS